MVHYRSLNDVLKLFLDQFPEICRHFFSELFGH